MNANSDKQGLRRLQAVLFADVAGYSRLMGQNEEETHRAVKEILSSFEEKSRRYGGEIIEVRGDGVFALFHSAVNAVRYAVDVQSIGDRKNREVPEDRRIRFRIGIHLGEVIRDEARVFGDCVNVAARIQGLAEPGGICVSAAVYEQVCNRVRYGYEYTGPQRLKNIREAVHVFRVRPEAAGADMAPSPRPAERDSSGERHVPARPSVVVLPFKNLGGDPAEDWFSDGVTEDIITSLSKFHSLFVIARSSAFAYKHRDVPVQQVGQELGVRYVAEGSVRKARKRLRVSVEIAESESDRTIWAEHYDRDLDEIFAVQDEITSMIVAATATQIEAAERERTRINFATDLRAYGFVLRGQQRLFRYQREDNFEARRLYQAALEADPRYARAVAGISRTLNIDWRYSWGESTEHALDRALELAEQAILLDESDARGFGELGFVQLYRKHHDASLAAYTRALTLNPNDADLMSEMADALGHSGRSEEAVTLLRNAMRLNPYYPDQYLWHLGGAYYNLGSYEEAIATVLGMHNPTEGHRILAASYAQLERMEEARRHAAKVLEAHPDFSLERWRRNQPDRAPEATEHFVEGLKKAGL